ncbi:MAG: preprotein translocase subunit SecA, partial [Candidatus Levybacteria bacterium CG10_big_fil_rev_8_21_14_0_10_36_7]
MSLFGSIFGSESSKFIKNIKKIVDKINTLEADISKLPDEAFPQKTQELKSRLEKGEVLDEILPEAFALVREAAKRNLGERHYDVQLIGGIALHQGKIA